MLIRPGRLPDRHPPLPSGQSLNPATTSHHARLSFTGHQQGFTHVHPSGLPFAHAAGMEPAALRLPPELRTPPSPATHVRGRDRPPSTDLELPLNSHASISNPAVHSIRATSRRTAIGRCVATGASRPGFVLVRASIGHDVVTACVREQLRQLPRRGRGKLTASPKNRHAGRAGLCVHLGGSASAARHRSRTNFELGMHVCSRRAGRCGIQRRWPREGEDLPLPRLAGADQTSRRCSNLGAPRVSACP